MFVLEVVLRGVTSIDGLLHPPEEGYHELDGVGLGSGGAAPK